MIAIGCCLALGQSLAWAGDAQSSTRSAVTKYSVAPPLDQGTVAAVRTGDSRDAAVRWREIQITARPARLIALCEEYERDFPGSRFVRQVADIAARARTAQDIQRSVGLSSESFDDAAGDSDYREDLLKVVNGDKDAAYRIAMAYHSGLSGLAVSPRRMEQWLRISAELGNGQASWALAEKFNNNGFVADAARFEKLALALGYRPPVRLPSRGY